MKPTTHLCNSILAWALLLFSCDSSSPPPYAESKVDFSKLSLVDSPTISGQNALIHSKRIIDCGLDRQAGSVGAQKQRQYLAQQLTKIGWQCTEESNTMSTPRGDVTFTNLRARYKGAPPFTQAIAGLLTCHVDTKAGIPHFQGANDGASGAALLLEIARVLSQTDPKRASQIELIFFDGEECYGEHMTFADGLYGSRAYVEAHLPHCPPRWLINLDMVGRQSARMRIPADTHPLLYNHFTTVTSQLTKSDPKLYPRNLWGVSGSTIMDDHLPFAALGIPTLNLIDDFTDGNWWHTEQDNLGILSPATFNANGNLILLMLQGLL